MADSDPVQLLRRLPSIHRLLERPGIQALIRDYSRDHILDLLNTQLDCLRRAIREGTLDKTAFPGAIARLDQNLEQDLQALLTCSLQPLINATGVLIHTNAGRSPMAAEALRQVSSIASHYTNLEYDLTTGERGERDIHFEGRARRLLKCEAATVCNNAAAALFLTLNTLAQGKKVLVSRGELIEIGGSFRIPEILEKSGALLKEVGTTNKTRASDYRKAAGDSTALILRVHPSNYRIVGFTQRPELEDLVGVARELKIPLLHDAGSGHLIPSDLPFLSREPTILGSLASGSDLVCFSGDKLLGGPQAGLIVGRAALIQKIRENPLMRVCRVDKMTYAALDWTLGEYETGRYLHSLPLWQFMTASMDDLRRRALKVCRSLKKGGYQAELVEGFSVTGGGSAPEEQIPTWLIKIRSDRHSSHQLQRRLRENAVPILARIEDDRLTLDLRAVFPHQDQPLAAAFSKVG